MRAWVGTGGLLTIMLIFLLTGSGCSFPRGNTTEQRDEGPARVETGQVGEPAEWNHVRLVLEEIMVMPAVEGRRPAEGNVFLVFRIYVANESRDPERISAWGKYAQPEGPEGRTFFFRGEEYSWQGHLAPGEETEQKGIWEVPADAHSIGLVFSTRGWQQQTLEYRFGSVADLAGQR